MSWSISLFLILLFFLFFLSLSLSLSLIHTFFLQFQTQGVESYHGTLVLPVLKQTVTIVDHDDILRVAVLYGHQ